MVFIYCKIKKKKKKKKKLKHFQSMEIAYPFIDHERIFLWIMTCKIYMICKFIRKHQKECSYTAVTSCQKVEICLRFVQEVVKYVWKIH